MGKVKCFLIRYGSNVISDAGQCRVHQYFSYFLAALKIYYDSMKRLPFS